MGGSGILKTSSYRDRPYPGHRIPQPQLCSRAFVPDLGLQGPLKVLANAQCPWELHSRWPAVPGWTPRSCGRVLCTASQNFLARQPVTAEPAHSVPIPDWCPPAGAVGVGFKEIPLTTVNSSVWSPLRHTALFFKLVSAAN